MNIINNYGIIKPKDYHLEQHAHAELCPVCKGKGIVVDNYQALQATSTTARIQYTCNGCKGKGWVTVIDSTQLSIK